MQQPDLSSLLIEMLCILHCVTIAHHVFATWWVPLLSQSSLQLLNAFCTACSTSQGALVMKLISPPLSCYKWYNQQSTNNKQEQEALELPQSKTKTKQKKVLLHALHQKCNHRERTQVEADH
jgi:hypothetical protein